MSYFLILIYVLFKSYISSITIDVKYIDANEFKNLTAPSEEPFNIVKNKIIQGPKIPYIELKINQVAYKLLIGTETSDSFIGGTKIRNCEALSPRHNYTGSSKKNTFTITSQYYKGQGSKTIKVDLTGKNETNETFSILDTLSYIYSYTTFGGVLGVKKENHSFTLDITNNKLFLEKNNFSEYKNCSKVCKLDYMIFGNEVSIYFAKRIGENVTFDALSYYSIFPYESIKNFTNDYFNTKDECVSKPVTIYNQESQNLYYISCSKKKIEISTKDQPINLILGGFSYKYSELFDDKFYLNLTETVSDTFYFNILFQKNLTGPWILGRRFFKGKEIGYNKNEVVLKQIGSVDFRKYQVNTVDKKGTTILFICGSLFFLIMFLILFILSFTSKRKITNEIEEMLNN